MSEPRPIYLDYHATTPVDPRVLAVMVHYLSEDFGNPSNLAHDFGTKAHQAVIAAALPVAELVGARRHEVVFTSGATESINLAIQGHVRASYRQLQRPIKVASMALEHKAVLDTCRYLAEEGLAHYQTIPVDACGQIDLAALEKACQEGLDLLCVMAANNEIGTVYPLAKISALVKPYGVAVFVDACQAAGKIPLDFQQWGLAYLALTAHKMYGPKGVGALVVRDNLHPLPLMWGGGQQKGLRSGTLNVPGIAALGETCRLRKLEMAEDEARIQQLRDRLQQMLQAVLPNMRVNGSATHRLAGNLHVSFPGVSTYGLLHKVRSRLALSAGSACSSAKGSSHVLQALPWPVDAYQAAAIRMGLGKWTTSEDIEQTAQILIASVNTLQPNR